MRHIIADMVIGAGIAAGVTGYLWLAIPGALIGGLSGLIARR